MFLSSGQIRFLIHSLDPPLIQPHPCETEESWAKRLNFIEGALWDLVLDDVSYMQESRTTPRIGSPRIIPAHYPLPTVRGRKPGPQALDMRDQDNYVDWYMTEGYYTATAMEVINLPEWIFAIVRPKRSFFGAQTSQDCTDAAPGFHGNISIGLRVGAAGLSLERGARFCSLRFAMFWIPDEFKDGMHRYAREVDIYKGIWNGRRLDTADKPEGERAF